MSMFDKQDIDVPDFGFERLPIPCLPGNEGALARAVSSVLESAKVAPSAMKDEIAMIAEEMALFAQDGGDVRSVTEDVIVAAVRAGLGSGFPDQAKRLGKACLDLLTAMRDHWKLSPTSAFALLSESGIVLRLAIELRMSSAGIAEMLGARGQASRWPWKAIQALLVKCGCAPTLGFPTQKNDQLVRMLWDEDMRELDETFADAALEDAIVIVAQYASELGMQAELAGLLATFFSDEDAMPLHEPYLQILHFQMIIAEFFDHPLTNAYEFSPRGKIAELVFAKYQAERANPFLNNLKGVERLDTAWALQRKTPQRAMAISLVSILEAASELPYNPRRRLAKFIRLFLLKVLQLRERPSQIHTSVSDAVLAQWTID